MKEFLILLMAFIAISSCKTPSQLATVIGIGMEFDAGLLDGVQQQTHAHPRWAEDIFHVPAKSWLGSQQWQLPYNEDGTHRSELLGNFGYDGWHTFDRLSTGLKIGGGGFIVGGSINLNQSPKQFIKKITINSVLGFGAHTLGANLSYRWVERRRHK